MKTSAGIAAKIARAGLKRPKVLTLAITGDCNLHCGHCWVESPRPQKAAASKLRGLIREFVEMGGQGICLTGGEPLTHPEWLDVVTFCCGQPGLQTVGVQTNAQLLTETAAKNLRDLEFEGLSFQVSLDGARGKTHDRVRGKGSFDQAMKGLGNLVRAGLGGRTTIAFTEMRHNMEDIPALLELAGRLGIHSVVGAGLVRHGRARRRTQLGPPSPGQYESLLLRYQVDAGFRALYRRLGKFAALEWWAGRLQERSDFCHFLENPYITVDGLFYPCVLLQADEFAGRGVFVRPLAHLIEENLPLWAELKEMSRRRAGSLDACSRCPGRSHCAGGCPGRAYAASGKIVAVEDRCSLRCAVYGWEPPASGNRQGETC